MKLLLQIVTLFALWGCSAVFAANLEIPMAFEYIAVDGKKISSSMFKHKNDLKLSQGHHEIAIRYKDMVENDVSDTKADVQSTAFIISLNIDGDYRYSLKPVGGDVIRDPQQFAKSPDVIIVRGDKGSVDYKVTLTDITEKSFAARLYGNNESEQLRPAAAAVAAIVPEASSTAVVGAGAGVGEAERNLHYWWQQADEKTRKEFLGWAIKQL